MRLNSINIKNFRVIKDAYIEFPDAVIGIIGRNGAGKSSIIEAISWALYGNQAARSGKAEIKSIFASADDECIVELVFVINDEKYRVVRRLIGKNNRAEVELYRGENSESVGVNETRAYVGQLLGLDWRSFLSSFLARQAELNALSDLQPSRRRDHIAGMLGIEKLDRAMSKIKDETKMGKDKTTFLQNQLSQKEIVEHQIVELKDFISKIKYPIVQQEKKVDEYKLCYEKTKSELDKINKQRVDFIKLEGQLKTEKESFSILNQQLESYDNELNELRQVDKEYRELLPKLDEIDKVNENYNDQLKVKSQFELFEQLNKRLSELNSEKKELCRMISATDEKLDEILNLMKEMPADVKGNLQNIEDNFQISRENYIRLESDLKQLLSEKKRLSDQLANIKKLKADSICDQCLRPFGEDYEKIKKHFNEDLNELNEKYQLKTSELSTLRIKGEKLKGEMSEFTQLVNKLSKFGIDKDKLEARKDQILLQLTTVESGIINTETEIKKTKVSSFDSNQFRMLEIAKLQLEKEIAKINQFKGRLEQIPKLEKSISSTISKIELIKINIKEIENKIKELNFSDSIYDTAITKHEKGQQELEQAKNKLSGLVKEQDISKASLEGKEDVLAQFNKSEKELEDTITDLYYLEKLNQLLSQYRQELIASIRPSLATISTRLFKEMTDNKYSLVELDEQYNLRVMDCGDFYDIDRFSGGEKDLANLCLRLAISLALTESAGLNRSFVILDEVFGSQDNERKELILKALARLKIQFPQILLITHIDDIKDGVEKIIEVLPTGNGYSEVNIV